VNGIRLALAIGLLVSTFVATATLLLQSTAAASTTTVILLQGWQTEDNDASFSAIRAELKKAAEKKGIDVRFVDFSYVQGSSSYSKCDTNQSLLLSAASLDALVHQQLRLDPDTRLVFVGHSLGGVVAQYWAGAVASDEELSSVDALITLDSPVGGVFGSVSHFIADYYGLTLPKCEGKVAFLDQIALESKDNLLDEIHSAGLKLRNRVYNIGSCTDSFIWCTSSAMNGGGISHVVFSGFQGQNDCTAAAALDVFAAAVLGQSAGFLPALLGDKVALDFVMGCYLASHSAVTVDPAVLKIISGVAFPEPPAACGTARAAEAAVVGARTRAAAPLFC